MSLQERFQQLEPRERQLLGILLSVLAVVVLLALPAGVAAILSSKRSENAALRETIDAIQAGRPAVIQHERERQQVIKRYNNAAPPLASLLEKAASAYKIEIPESQDQAPVPHGKRYEERSTKLSLHKIGMLNLVSFLEKLEQSGHPVAITKLDIRKRGTETDSYDVDMVLSAFDRKAEDKDKDKKKSDTTGKDDKDEAVP